MGSGFSLLLNVALFLHSLPFVVKAMVDGSVRSTFLHHFFLGRLAKSVTTSIACRFSTSVDLARDSDALSMVPFHHERRHWTPWTVRIDRHSSRSVSSTSIPRHVLLRSLKFTRRFRNTATSVKTQTSRRNVDDNQPCCIAHHMVHADEWKQDVGEEDEQSSIEPGEPQFSGRGRAGALRIDSSSVERAHPGVFRTSIDRMWMHVDAGEAAKSGRRSCDATRAAAEDTTRST